MSTETELQKYLFDALTGDAGVMALVDGVYDRVPADPFGANETYVSFGPHTLLEDDADCITADRHDIQIDVWSRTVGKVACKTAGHAIRRLLHRREVEMTTNALAMIEVASVRYMTDRDGLTTHGVISVVAVVEEP